MILRPLPLLDHVNLIPKSMYCKFPRPVSDLEHYEQRVKFLELKKEALLLAFTECLTTEGRADEGRFASDFGLLSSDNSAETGRHNGGSYITLLCADSQRCLGDVKSGWTLP